MSQSKTTKCFGWGERLREERVLLGLQQGPFSAKFGISQQTQSQLENEARELRGEYLTALHNAGIDIVYILSGERIVSDRLDVGTSEIVGDLLKLPSHQRNIIRELVRSMLDLTPERPAQHSAIPTATLHESSTDYRPEKV